MIRTVAIAVAVVTITAVLLAQGLTKEDAMNITQARNDPAIANQQPFPSELEEVQSAWGEPIPDHLLRIGGLDEWGWAAVSYTLVDGVMQFEGEYRNGRMRYIGPFERVGGRDTITPETIFVNYVMSHIDDTDLVMREINAEPPWDSFILRPADPSKIEDVLD